MKDIKVGDVVFLEKDLLLGDPIDVYCIVDFQEEDSKFDKGFWGRAITEVPEDQMYWTLGMFIDRRGEIHGEEDVYWLTDSFIGNIRQDEKYYYLGGVTKYIKIDPVKDTKLARKMYKDKIIHEKEGWIWVKK